MKRVDYFADCGAVVFTALQTEEIFQIISLIFTIISIIVSLSFTIYKWYKEAKKDGKITEEEIKELTKKIKDENVDKIIETIEKEKRRK